MRYSDFERAGQLRGSSSSPIMERFVSSPRPPHPFWGPPNLLYNGKVGPFHRKYCGQGVKLTTHLRLEPRSRTLAFIHPLPYMSSWRSTRTSHFYLYYTTDGITNTNREAFISAAGYHFQKGFGIAVASLQAARSKFSFHAQFIHEYHKLLCYRQKCRQHMSMNTVGTRELIQTSYDRQRYTYWIGSHLYLPLQKKS
jgi:hypothetical protein